MNNVTEKKGLTIQEWFINKTNINNQAEINRFKSNVLSISQNFGLQKANKQTILEACAQASLLQLPLEKNFGYCYVVPIKGQAQFHMGYKGYIQLAMRSQQYKIISTSDVRQGELKKIDRLKGIKFNWIQNELERLEIPIIGYTAFFKLKNGFEKTLYWTKEQCIKHFKVFSPSYKKDGKFTVSDFESMALKTVLTQLLRKWGIMSVEMQQAYDIDQAVIIDDKPIYIDNPNNNDNNVENEQEPINTSNKEQDLDSLELD